MENWVMVDGPIQMELKKVQAEINQTLKQTKARTVQAFGRKFRVERDSKLLFFIFDLLHIGKLTATERTLTASFEHLAAFAQKVPKREREEKKISHLQVCTLLLEKIILTEVASAEELKLEGGACLLTEMRVTLNKQITKGAADESSETAADTIYKMADTLHPKLDAKTKQKFGERFKRISSLMDDKGAHRDLIFLRGILWLLAGKP